MPSTTSYRVRTSEIRDGNFWPSLATPVKLSEVREVIDEVVSDLPSESKNIRKLNAAVTALHQYEGQEKNSSTSA